MRGPIRPTRLTGGMESTADIEVGDVVAPRAAVSIEITSTPVLSYALAHNRVPVVSRLAITNFGGPVRAATVRLGVRDAEGPIAQTRRAAGRPRRGPDDGAHRPRPGHGPRRDAARRGAAPGRRSTSRCSSDGETARRGQPRRPGARRPAVAGHSPAAGAGDARRVRHAQPPGDHRAGRARRPTCWRSRPAAAPSSGYAAAPERVDEVVRGDRRGHARPRHPLQRAAASAGPTSGSRCARRATSSPGGSAPRWTPSSSWPPPWSRPASGRCCGWPTGTRSSATGARSAAPRAPRPPTPLPWSTWSTSG